MVTAIKSETSTFTKQFGFTSTPTGREAASLETSFISGKIHFTREALVK